MSICRVPFNFAAHDLDSSMPNLGGMSAMTTSITMFFEGIWASDMTKSLMRPKHLTFLESKEKRSL
jgi:hypothetical protein